MYTFEPVNITALAGLFALVAAIITQLVKPFFERIPALQGPNNKDVHDAVLRILQYVLNLVFLSVAVLTYPMMFFGVAWWDILALAFGQALASHFAYSTLSKKPVAQDGPQQHKVRSADPQPVTIHPRKARPTAPLEIPTIPRG